MFTPARPSPRTRRPNHRFHGKTAAPGLDPRLERVTAASPAHERRRPRPGSLERPVNARLYRGTWLLVGLPLLLLSFSVARPPALRASSSLPPAFDADQAASIAESLAEDYPNREPGTQDARGAAGWFRRPV